MEPEGLLPQLQEPASCPCPEPDQFNPCSPSHVLKIRSYIILPLTAGSSKWSLSLGLYAPFISPVLATCIAHLILVLITRIILDVEHKSLRSSLYSLLHFPFIQFLLGSNMLLSNQFSNTLILRSSLNVSDRFSRSYKTTDNIIVLYILICIYLAN